MRKNQRPNLVIDPWYIPAVLTGNPEFGAPNCPVRALKYYHRYMSEHPELRKGRRHLFIPFKDSNAGKELSVASISDWGRVLGGTDLSESDEWQLPSPNFKLVAQTLL